MIPARPCFACRHHHNPDSPGTCWEAECLPSCPEHDLEPVSFEPAGFLGATRHDFDDHRLCDPDACPNAEPAS